MRPRGGDVEPGHLRGLNDAGQVAGSVRVSLDDSAAAEVLSTSRQALRERRRLHVRYLVPARDETTERDVDPMRVVSIGGHWYLEGWCHRVEDVRLFRLDRVLEVDGTSRAGRG